MAVTKSACPDGTVKYLLRHLKRNPAISKMSGGHFPRLFKSFFSSKKEKKNCCSNDVTAFFNVSLKGARIKKTIMARQQCDSFFFFFMETSVCFFSPDFLQKKMLPRL